MQGTSQDVEAVFRTKAKVVRLADIYQFKFGEHLGNYGDVFFQAIWQVVADNRVTSAREAERLVFALVKYIGECAKSIPSYADFLKGNLQHIWNVLVIPNISLTSQDVEEFEDDP
jgi:hypothetical protein